MDFLSVLFLVLILSGDTFMRIILAIGAFDCVIKFFTLRSEYFVNTKSPIHH